MKLFKKTLIILGTLVVLVTLFSLFAINTQAVSTNYSNTIYYFNDYYPSISPTTMESHSTISTEYDIVYDHMWIDSQGFDNLVSSGYFSSFDPGCVVIIDIKTFKPCEDMLSVLFSHLKTLQCSTVFVSAYTLTQFDTTSFLSFVDIFCHSNFSRLDEFIDAVLEQMFPTAQSLQNTAILIDWNSLNYSGTSSLLSHPPFMSRFLERMLDKINNLSPAYVSQTGDTINNMISALHANNVNIFINVGDGEYINLFDLLYNPTFSTVYEDILGVSDLPTSSDTSYEYIYAIGIWELNSYFYDFLYQEQSSITAIFIMDTEIPEYSEDGLPVTLASELSEPSNEELELFALLLELLGIDPID